MGRTNGSGSATRSRLPLALISAERRDSPKNAAQFAILRQPAWLNLLLSLQTLTPSMITLLSLALLVMVAALTTLLFALTHTDVGYEDDLGFHSGGTRKIESNEIFSADEN